MHQPQDTLGYLRHSVLLRHSSLLWVSSAVLVMVFLIVEERASLGLVLLLMLASLTGLLLSRLGGVYLRSHPGWNPTFWLGILAFMHGLAWGYQARHGDVGLMLAIAFTGMAGMAFFANWRAMVAAWLPVAALPLVLEGNITGIELLEIHSPLMALTLLGSWRGHRMALRSIENTYENRRLNELLLRHRDQLEQTVQRRTAELEDSNERLNDEVELRRQINQALVKSDEQLNLAMAASGIGFWDWDIANRRVYHSDPERFFGHARTANEFIDLHKQVDKADRAAVRRALALNLRSRSAYYHARYRIWREGSNEPAWLEDSGRVIERDLKGRPVRMVGTRRDITDDMRLQEELRLSSTLFNNSPDGVFILDSEQRLRTCNRVFDQIIQRQKGQLIGLPLFQVIPTEQQQRIAKGMINNNRWEGDIVALRGAHERFPMSLKLTAIKGADGRVNHYLGICRDLTESRRHEMQLDYLQNFDKLTGLFNRGYFHRLLKQFEEHDPLRVNHYAIAVVNLDRFKTINESLGQDVGDQLLRDVAARLNNLSDPVRQVARLGSDEFAMLIEHEGDRDALLDTLNTALREISRPCLIEEHELVVTASIGACIVHHDNQRLLLNQSIAAMNTARQNGGNRVQVYQPSLASQPAARNLLKGDLQQAVEAGAISVAYQPKLSLASGLIDSMEALARWQHPQQGWIDPEVFIPLAEETGLISQISNLVLDQACRDAARWRRDGLGDISVSVNLSSHQVYGDDFHDRIEKALRDSGLPAEYLELEVTESMLMEDVAHAQEYLTRLRARGLHLALDDFGTGYTSLNYLKRFPIDILKIDRSFLREVTDGSSSPVIEAIMAMAASLKMTVVAEGVETREQLQYMKRLGCDYIQGYLISRPLPAEEILPLVRHSNQRFYGESEPELLH